MRLYYLTIAESKELLINNHLLERVVFIMNKNYGDNYFGNEENIGSNTGAAPSSSENTGRSAYSGADTNPYTSPGTASSNASQNTAAQANSADSSQSAGSTGYGENIYSSSSAQPQGSGSYGSSFFDKDGNYRRSYSPTDQPAGSYDAGGYSSTRYINNSESSDSAQRSAQSGSYYTTPQSYYTPTSAQQQNVGKKKKEKKKGRGAMAAVMVVCILASGVLGFGGGMLANRVDFTGSGSGSGMQVNEVVQTVSADTGSSGSMSTEDIVKKTQDSVVEITTETVQTGTFTGNYITSGAGSGVIVSENGYIITNNHVIEDANTITVTTKDGTGYEATVVGTAAPQLDIALLKIDATGLTPATLGDSDQLEVGEKAVAIGNPLGQLGGTVTEGIISALNRDISIDGVSMELLQTNAEINPGNSGGGLFDGMGNLIGIVVAKSTGEEVEGLGFAIPVNSVKDVLSDLQEYGYVTGIVDTGLQLLDITNAQTAMIYGVSETGLYIQGIDTGSKASVAGFRVGDRIVSVDGTEVNTADEFDDALAEHEVGDEVTIRVSRDGRTADISLELEEYEPESSSTSNGFINDGIYGDYGNMY